MARCPECDYPLPDDRETIGSRCPSCHDPLYEPPGRFGRPVGVGEVGCAVHPTNESLGPCMRCGKGICEICQCHWHRQVLCAACVSAAMSAGEGPSEPGREPIRQARWGLILGLLGWAMAWASMTLAGPVASTTGPLALVLLFLTLGLMGASAGLALCGLGQASAALLVSGKHDFTAGTGLLVSAGLLALMLGTLVLGAWLVDS